MVSRVEVRKLFYSSFVSRVIVSPGFDTSVIEGRVVVRRLSLQVLQCRFNVFKGTTNRVLICRVTPWRHVTTRYHFYARVTVVYVQGSLDLVSRVTSLLEQSSSLVGQVNIVERIPRVALGAQVTVLRTTSMSLVCRFSLAPVEGYRLLYSHVYPSVSLRSLCQRHNM